MELFTNFNSIGNALGWTLVHFLWQGLILFVSYWVVTRLFLKNKITQQYWVGMFFIGLCLIVPIREFIIQLNINSVNEGIVQLLNSSITAEYTSGIISPFDLSLMLLYKVIPYLVIAWILSVLLISSHLFRSWLALLKLSKDTSIKLPENLMNKLEEVSMKLKLKFNPIISISEKIKIPATFGFFKPVILLPLSLISKLPNEQMEAILIHELCHIKRADFLHNILQLLVETLFFYHPLTKWISRDVRKVREQCCDKMVLELKTNPLVYANALTNIASIYNKHNNNDNSHLQIAANDGELFNRIKFLMMDKRSSSSIVNITLGITLSIWALLTFNDIISNLNKTPHSKSNPSITQSLNQIIVRPEYETPNIYGLMKNKKILNNSSFEITTKYPTTLSILSINKTIESNDERKSISSKSSNLNPKFSTNVNNLNSNSIATQDFDKIDSNTLVSKEKIIINEHSKKSFPKIIKKVHPIYKNLAQLNGIEGTVILSFMINHKGKVKNINVDKSSPMKILDSSAKSALRKWRFDPNSINERNFQKRYQQIFSFKLEQKLQCVSFLTGSRIANQKNCEIIKH